MTSVTNGIGITFRSMADISTTTEKSRSEVANYLREFAEKLDTGQQTEITDEHHGPVTVTLGNESATVNPPETVEFGVKIDTDPSLLEVGHNQGVTLTLRWDANDVERTDDIEVH